MREQDQTGYLRLETDNELRNRVLEVHRQGAIVDSDFVKSILTARGYDLDLAASGLRITRRIIEVL